MGLLDGQIQALFGTVFAGIYPDGTLIKESFVDDGMGGGSLTPASYPIKVQVDRYSEAFVASRGLPAGSTRLIVLQHGVTVIPDSDDKITTLGKTYRIATIEGVDTAQAAWFLRAVPDG
jgi:hypothetical protein